MLSYKNHQATGEETIETTPLIVESAVQEILQYSNDILKMYGIPGEVKNIDLGLHPVDAATEGSRDYELSILEDDDYALSVKFSLRQIRKG